MVQRSDDGSELARLLVSIRSQQRTGVLEVVAEGVTTLLYFRDGRIVFAEQGTLGETLGRILLRDGRITQEQYAKIIDRMTASLVDSEQMRFGEAAIALGFLQPQDVSDALAGQVRRKLVHCFQWEHPSCAFDPNPEALREVAHFPSDTLPLVLEGVRRFYDHARAERVLAPFLERFPQLVGSADEVCSQLGLHPAEARFVRHIDGRRRLEDLLAGAELDSLLARQIAAGLVLTGSVQLLEETPPIAAHHGEPPARRPPVEDVKPPQSAVQTLAREIARRRRAGNLRRSSVPPADAQRARLEAEQAYQRGRRQMGYGAWPLALEEFRRAVRRCPDVVEYELYAKWAEHRATPPKGPSEARRARDDLAGLAVRALKKDRENAFAWHVLGQLAIMAGDDARAHKSFRIATRLDPEDLEAARWVRILSSRLAAEAKGKKT